MKNIQKNNILNYLIFSVLFLSSLGSLFAAGDGSDAFNEDGVYDPLKEIENDRLGPGVYVNKIPQSHLDEMQAMIDAYNKAHAKDEVPDQLFDITFTLDTFVVPDVKELTGLVTYTSFGQVPTPVNYTFTLKDKATGEILRKYPGYIVVQTEMVEIVYFEELHDLQLKEGDYTLTYRSVYNYDVVDEFVQEFKIQPKKSESGFDIFWVVIIGVVLLIGGGLVFFFKK